MKPIVNHPTRVAYQNAEIDISHDNNPIFINY